MSRAQKTLITLEEAQDVAEKEQPRNPINRTTRRKLPYADPHVQYQSPLLSHLPLDVRLLIWDYVLTTPYTSIERWRPACDEVHRINHDIDFLDIDCFPYRLSVVGVEEEKKGKVKGLALLLCCRQVYTETIKLLYTTTTFFFTHPIDLSSFVQITSPTGLTRTRNMVLAFPQMDDIPNGILRASAFSIDEMKDSENALAALSHLTGLQTLHIWLTHAYHDVDGDRSTWPTRPWEERGRSAENAEQRHGRLFGLLASITYVPHFTLHLSWNPVDVLSGHSWPFEVDLQTAEDRDRILADIPMYRQRVDAFQCGG